jgi:hypothetical protein
MAGVRESLLRAFLLRLSASGYVAEFIAEDPHSGPALNPGLSPPINKPMPFICEWKVSTQKMDIFIVSMFGLYFVGLLVGIAPWFWSVVSHHFRYLPDPGHDRAAKREERWYHLR